MHPPPEPSLDHLMAHRAWIGALARSLVANDHDADDLAQDIYLAALKRLPRQKDPRGWITAVARNLVGSRRRGDRRRARREEEAARLEALPSAAEVVERAALHRRIVDAVLTLPEPCRSTVLFRFFEDMPPRLIARRAGVPVETVRTRLKRGRELLREKLDDAHDGDRAAWVGLVALHYGAGGATAAAAAGGALSVAKLSAGTALVAGMVLATGWITGWFGSSPSIPGEGEPVARRTASTERTPIVDRTAGTRAPTRTAPPARAVPDAAIPDRSRPAPAALAPRAPYDGTVIQGRVATRTGDAVPDATVTALHLYRGGAEWQRQGTALREVAHARTDADGAFAFPGLDGPVLLRVDAPAHARDYTFAATGGHRDIIVDGARVLRGTVRRGDERAPCAGALVVLFERASRVNVFGFQPDGEAFTYSQTVAYAQAITDAAGRFAVPNTAPGRYRVAVFTRDGPVHAPQDLVAHVRDDATDVIEIDVPRRDAADVSGRVTDAEGAPVEGAVVRVSGHPLRHATTDGAGQFRLAAVADERMTLVVGAPGYVNATGEIQTVSGGRARVTLHRPCTAVGVVRGADDRPVADAIVSSTVHGGRAVTDARGRFVLRGLPAGVHRFHASVAGAGHAVSDAISLRPNARVDVGPLRLVAAGSIAGRLALPAGVGRDGIHLVLRSGSTDPTPLRHLASPLGAATDRDGRFRFAGVPPGTYRIAAWIGGQYHTFAERVDVVAGAERAVVLRIATPGSIVSGRVTDARGHAIPHAIVKVMSEGDDTPRAFTYTGEQGWFRLIGVPSDARLIVESQGRHFKHILTEVHGRSAPLAIALHAKDAIRGTVRMASTGDAARRFWVRAFPRRDARGVAAGLEAKRFFDGDDGRFSLAVRHDPFRPPPLIDSVYDIEAGAGDFVSDVVAGVPFEPGAVRRGLSLALRPGGWLAGRVVDAAERPIADARVVVSSATRSTRAYPLRTDADGRFRLRPLSPGAYRVAVHADGLHGRADALIVRGAEARVTVVARTMNRSTLGAPAESRPDERK